MKQDARPSTVGTQLILSGTDHQRNEARSDGMQTHMQQPELAVAVACIANVHLTPPANLTWIRIIHTWGTPLLYMFTKTSCLLFIQPQRQAGPWHS